MAYARNLLLCAVALPFKDYFYVCPYLLVFEEDRVNIKRDIIDYRYFAVKFKVL